MIEFIATTSDFIGKLLIAYTALRVHHRFLSEHKVDRLVFRAMKREQRLGILGIIFIVAGYLLKIAL
ncbi:MAG: hypothetical protein KJI72_03230 [Patescibacteria group bacterium]|nr:hypothetical protein [Patescibacteria group bacterium]